MKRLILLTFALCLLTVGLKAQTYYLVENNEITLTGLPTSYTSADGTYWFKNYHSAPESVWYADGFRVGVTPAYNAETQYLGAVYYDIGNDNVTREVIDYTEAHLAAKQEAELQAIESNLDVKKMKYLLQQLYEPVIDTMSMDSTDIAAFMSIYDQWRIGVAYTIDDKVVSDSSLYKVVQAHTSQSDWLPANTPALYTPFTPAGVIAEWVQPSGAQDAYELGATVTYNGSTWESTVADNVWEPGVYGWTVVN